MRIAIVGGLGYLGSHLTHYLEPNHDVTVYDINAFASEYVPSKATVRNTNFLSVSNRELRQYDLVIVSCLCDVGEFYEAEDFKEYTEQIQTKILSMKNINTLVFISMFADEQFKKYTDELMVAVCHINEDAKITLAPVPELYGGDKRIRTDLFINGMLSEFLQYNRYVLDNELLKEVRFTHITNYVRYIESGLEYYASGGLRDESTDEFCIRQVPYCVMSKFMIANYISWMLGPDFELYIRPDENLVLDTTGKYSFDETDLFEYTLSMYTKLQQLNKTADFFNTNTNNRYIINNTLVGNRFTKSILNDKSV